MKHTKHLLLFLMAAGFILLCGQSFAEGLDWSGTARSAMSIYQFTSNFLAACMLSIGVGFLGSACLNYKYYRQNPVQTPLNKPITLGTLAVVLILFAIFIKVSLPYVYETNEKDVTISKIFEPKNEKVKLPPLPVTKPADPRFAQHKDENHIDLDSPYM